MNNLVGVVLVLPFVLIALVVLLQVLERCLRALDSLLLARERSSSANRAAEVLLREFLTAAEYRHLCATGSLEIASPTQPGRVYRVPRGSGGVDVLEGRRCTEHLCLQPLDRDLPDADVVLLHKLLIQADEEFYLRTANHFRDPFWRPSSPGQLGSGGCRTWT